MIVISWMIKAQDNLIWVHSLRPKDPPTTNKINGSPYLNDLRLLKTVKEFRNEAICSSKFPILAGILKIRRHFQYLRTMNT